MGKKITEFEAEMILGKIGGFCSNEVRATVIRSVRDKAIAAKMAEKYHISLTQLEEVVAN